MGILVAALDQCYSLHNLRSTLHYWSSGLVFSWVYRRILPFVAIISSLAVGCRRFGKGERARQELLNLMEDVLGRTLDVLSRITLVTLQSITWIEAAAELLCLIVTVWYRNLATCKTRIRMKASPPSLLGVADLKLSCERKILEQAIGMIFPPLSSFLSPAVHLLSCAHFSASVASAHPHSYIAYHNLSSTSLSLC